MVCGAFWAPTEVLSATAAQARIWKRVTVGLPGNVSGNLGRCRRAASDKWQLSGQTAAE
jgi:hypothetical protein